MIITPVHLVVSKQKNKTKKPHAQHWRIKWWGSRVVYEKWKNTSGTLTKTQTQPTTTHTQNGGSSLCQKLHHKRKGETKEVECWWMERKTGKERQPSSADVDAERYLVLQCTESILHVLMQLCVISFNLCLTFLHRVLKERETDAH